MQSAARSPLLRWLSHALPAAALLLLALRPALATEVLPLTVEDTAQQAGGIFVGQVAEVHTHWGDVAHRWISTDCTYQVERVIQAAPGLAAGTRVTLGYWGGTLGGRTEGIAGMEIPTAGQRYVVMLRSDWPAPGFSPAVGLYKGMFSVRRDPATGQAVVRGGEGEPLADGGATIGRVRELRAAQAGRAPVTLNRFVTWLQGNLRRIKARPRPERPPVDWSNPRIVKPSSQKPELPELRPGTQGLFYSDFRRPLGLENNGSLLPAAEFAAEVFQEHVARPRTTSGGAFHPNYSFTGGAADIPIKVNAFLPALFPQFSPEDQYQLSKWNRYANIFQVYTEPTGTYGWHNDRYDLDGFLDSATLNDVYGKPWDENTLAICFTSRDGDNKIVEGDIAFNAAFPFTLDDEYVYGSQQPVIYPFRATMLHEMGHMWGLAHQFNEVSIMNYCQYPFRAFGFPFGDDTAAIRAQFPDQAQPRTDFGVSFFTADGYQSYAPSTYSTSVVAGQYVHIGKFRLENLGTVTGTPTVSWYLSPQRNFVSNRLLYSAPFQSELVPNQYYEVIADKLLPVPHDMAPGNYYLMARLGDDDGAAQSGFPFNNNVCWTQNKITILPAIQSLTLNPTTIHGGESSTATLTLTGPAPAGGLLINPSISNILQGTVPSPLTVPAGASSLTFNVTTYLVTQATDLVVTVNSPVGTASSGPLHVIPQLPAAPSALTAVVSGGTTFRLEWHDNSDNEAGFHIEVAYGATGEFGAGGTAPAQAQMYQYTPQTPNLLYRFRVRAYNDGGESGPTNTVSVTAPGIPAAPSNLRIDITSGYGVTVNWHDNSSNEVGFRIERKSGTGEYAEILSVGENTVSAPDSPLAAETVYTYRVRASSLLGFSAYTAPVSVKLLAAPSDLTATGVSLTSVSLKWKDHSPSEDGFRVERRTADGAYQQVATRSANQTQYQDNAVPACTTFYYRVRAFDKQGNSGASNEAGFQSGCPPAAPTGIYFSMYSSTQLLVGWNDKSDNELNFLVERKAAGAAYKQIGLAAANQTTYMDETVLPGKVYSYRVRANNAVGYSDYVVRDGVSTLAAPSSLKVVLKNGKAVLTWQDNSSGELGFDIRRKAGSGAFVSFASAPPNATSAEDGTLEVCKQYVYEIRASAINGGSSYSDGALIQTACAPAGPTALTLKYIYQAGGTYAQLSWTDKSKDETGFVAQMREDATEWADAGTTGANSNSQNVHVAGCKNYHFRVRAINAGGNSAYSNEVAGLPICPPNAPTGFTATRSADGKTIKLQWTDTSENETKFSIERQVDAGGFMPAIVVAANTTSYNDQFLKPEKTYSYRMRSLNEAGFSAYTSVASPPGGGPVNLTATAVSSIQVRLDWTDNCQGETLFVAQTSTDGVHFTNATSVAAGLTTATVSYLTPGTAYYFRVVGVKSETGFSPYTNVATATTFGPSVNRGARALPPQQVGWIAALRWVRGLIRGLAVL